MIIRTHWCFDKKFLKLREAEKQRFKKRRDLFLENPFDPILRNHALHGKYEGFRSISVGGDLRAIYKYEAKDAIIFADIDTHHNLFGN